MPKTKNSKYVDELKELLSIPSISAQSAHKKDMEKAANWLIDKLKSLNFKTRIMPTGGHPVVYTENLEAGKSKPTVLVYGHYDVQAPDPLEEWLSDPFKPEVRDGNIYARGAADDKGQLFTWVAAVEELLQKSELPVNIKFFIEGEEEIGSANLETFVKKNKKLLASDICVISDSHSLDKTTPVITYGLRGLVYTEINIRALAKDVHSGGYGGNVLNPANVLSQVIAQLKDKNHKVLIPGFYESVRKISANERSVLEKFPFRKKEVMSETGAKEVVGEREFSVQLRAGARPTLDVNGMWGGYTGEGPKTIIPAEASAKISMRLVPKQDPKKIYQAFKDYVQSLLPTGVDYKCKLLSLDEPIIMDTSSRYFEKAENAFKKTFGKKPLYELSGGSIPVTAMLKQNLNLDSILMGYGLPDDGLHSPNEKLSLEMFEKGIQTNVNFLTSL